MPKNILMIGPTGVGKTEISRRLAKLAQAPFLKVEATKFTEVGYVGRDVEQIIRDLVEIGIGLVRERKRKDVAPRPRPPPRSACSTRWSARLPAPRRASASARSCAPASSTTRRSRSRCKRRRPAMPTFEIPGMPGAQMGMIIDRRHASARHWRRTRQDAPHHGEGRHEPLLAEEADKLLDQEQLVQEAIRVVENNGIVFLDEIDKICARDGRRGGGDVSREGVQRDLLPLIEGTTVSTKHGAGEDRPHPVHRVGRLPCRQALRPAARTAGPAADPRRAAGADARRFRAASSPRPKPSLIKQYVALLATEGVTLHFTDDAIDAIADVAVEVNAQRREHRRAAPADGDGARARRDLASRRRTARARPSRSTRNS